jgi:hypothetical protein
MSVPDFEWYDPPRGAGVPSNWTVEHLVSYHRSTTNAVKKAANKLQADAQFVLDSKAQKRTKDGAQIKVVHETDIPDDSLELADRKGGGLPMKLDSIVYLSSPDEQGEDGGSEPARAATSIEFGWTSKGKFGERRNDGIAPLATALKKSLTEARLNI